MRSVDQRLWRGALCAYGVLSLSTMAGMSIGAGLFMAVSLYALARYWKDGGREAVRGVARHPLSWATLALFLTAFLSLASAWIFPPLGEPVSGFRELKKFHHFLYPPLIALAFLLTADQMERHPFWKFWAGMGIFSALLAVLQFFGADLFPEAWLTHRFFRSVGETGRFHGQGLMFFHLSFAASMTFVAAAGLARLLWPLRWQGQRWLWWAVALAGFLGTALSFSRIAFVGLAVVAAVLAFLKRPAWGMVALALILFTAVGAWKFSPAFRDRFVHTMGGNHERVLMWQSAWEMFRERPLNGFGFGRSGAYTPVFAERILGKKAEFTSHAHNNFLDTLAATGLLGLLAYGFWWLVLLVSSWRSFRVLKEKWLPAAAFAAFLAFQVNGLTQVNFWDGKSQHTLMVWAGVALALDLRRRKEEEARFRA